MTAGCAARFGKPAQAARPPARRRRPARGGRLRAALACAVSAGAARAQTFDFATPSDDQWQYPFNFTLGSRPLASCFSSLGTGVPAFANFNNRDGVLVIAWDTSGSIPAGQGPANYDVSAVTITLVNESGAIWLVDLTPDPWFTFDVDNDGFINPDGVPRGEPGDTDGESDDPDPGRPLELFGAGFGPVYTAASWNEFSPYAGGTDQAANPRDPFPFVFQDGSGAVLHVEDSVVGRWNEALGVFNFTPEPWAVGVPIDYMPGAQTTTFEVAFDVGPALADGAVYGYFQQQLDAGRVFVVVTGMIETVMGGEPGAIPRFFTKEGVGLEPGAAAPRLTITLGAGLDGDLDGDGCVDLTDLATLLSNFGLTGVGPEDGDIDGDGDVDLADLAVLLANFGAGDCG